MDLGLRVLQEVGPEVGRICGFEFDNLPPELLARRRVHALFLAVHGCSLSDLAKMPLGVRRDPTRISGISRSVERRSQ